MKKALLLCASHNDLGLIRALRKLGYFIICTGNREDAPGQKFCDAYIKADYSDKERILAIAKDYQIDAIVQCCNDFGVYTAAYVAEQLGLPGYDDYETTLTLHNKDRFKAFALAHGIVTPASRGFTSKEAALQYVRDAMFPLIVKPVDASAGNGTSRVKDITSAARAIRTAFSVSRGGRIVIEPFITGTQHGFCTFLREKRVVAVCSNNEYSLLNPYRVELDTFPAANYEEVHDFLIAEIEKMARLLNLKDGIFHLQYIYDGKQPQILEVMRRILGNMYHVPGNLLTGMDWEYWETRAKCGLSLENFPRTVQEGYFAYKTLLGKQNGVIRHIVIPERYRKYLIRRYDLLQPGDRIARYRSEPVGFLFFAFDTEERMQQMLVEEYQDDLVRMEPGDE